jgi:hypothetical protein
MLSILKECWFEIASQKAAPSPVLFSLIMRDKQLRYMIISVPAKEQLKIHSLRY